MTGNNTLSERLLDNLSDIARQTNHVIYSTMGLNGHRFVTDDSYSNETFGALVAWDGADAQVDYTVTKLDGTTITHSNVTLTNGGTPIYGVITGLNVDSGTVCAYYGVEFR